MAKHFYTLMIAALVLSATHNAEAQSFGIEMGTPIEALDVREAGSSPQRGFYYLETVPKPHSKLRSYTVTATEQLGVCAVTGLGNTHEGDPLGLKVRADFDSLKTQLAVKYGSAKTTAIIFPGAKWGDDNDWVKSINENERLHSAGWGKDSALKPRDNIMSIYLWVMASSPNEARIGLTYSFSSFETCKETTGLLNESDRDAL